MCIFAARLQLIETKQKDETIIVSHVLHIIFCHDNLGAENRLYP